MKKSNLYWLRHGKPLFATALTAALLTNVLYCTETMALPFGKAKEEAEEPAAAEDAPNLVPAVKLTKGQQNEFDTSLANGNVYLKQNNFDLAKLCYLRCVTLNPNNSDAHLGLAYCYVAFKKKDLAIPAIFDSLRCDPNKRDARFLLGDIMMKESRFDEAGGQYLQILKNDMNDLSARGNLATCFFMMGQMDPAIGQFKYILEKDPKNSQAAYNLATSYDYKKQYDDAAQYYKKVLELDPENTNAFCSLAKCLIAKKNYADAKVLLKEAVKRNPNNHYSHLMSGYLWEIQGEKTDAIREYTKAVALAPKDGESIMALERLLQGGGSKMKNGSQMKDMKMNKTQLGGLRANFDKIQ